MSTDRSSLIQIEDRIPQLTTTAIGAASPDYVRQPPVRVLHYRSPRPGIGVRIRYTQPAPTPGVPPPLWAGVPIHGDSHLLRRPWARRVETRLSVSVGSATLDYTLTDPEISLWVPGDSVSVDVSLTYHLRWHRWPTAPVSATALRLDPLQPGSGVTSIPPVTAMASAWHSPSPCSESALSYQDTVSLVAPGPAQPLSPIPPWAREVEVWPAQIGTAVSWGVTFLWPYLGSPGQGLLSSLQQTSTTHYTAQYVPIPHGAVFCTASGITAPVQDWTFAYRGRA